MPKNPPDSMRSSLRQRLNARARERWPGLTRIEVRHRAGFAYVALAPAIKMASRLMV